MNEQRALTQYGSRDDIKELAERIQRFTVGNQKISPADALAVAQIAIAHGLNPFNGEVWLIPTQGVTVGIKGLRAAARKQSNYHIEFKRLDDEEKKEMGLLDGDIARRCEIYRLDLWQQMGKAARPIIGYGVCRKTDKTRMEHLTAAMKRAEADALKRAYDLPFEVSDMDTLRVQSQTPVDLDAEFVPHDETPAQNEPHDAKQDARDLFGEGAN